MNRNFLTGKHVFRNFITLIVCLIPVFIIVILYLSYRLPGGYSRYTVDMTGVWKISEGTNDEWIKPGYNDSGWKEIKFPGSYYFQGFRNRNSTARKIFEIKENMKDKDLFFTLGTTEGLFGNIYVNGHKIGEIGTIVNNKKTQGMHDFYGFIANQEFLFNNKSGQTNVIAIQFEDVTPGYDLLQDPRIIVGSAEFLKPYYQKSVFFDNFFQDGINLASILILVILAILVFMERNPSDRSKYFTAVNFIFSAFLYNLAVSNSYLKYFLDFSFSMKLLGASIAYLCLTGLDFIQYYYFKKISIPAKINRAVCLATAISFLFIGNFAVIMEIYSYFACYFLFTIVYICALSVTGTIRSKEKSYGIIITVSMIIAWGAGIVDLFTNLGIVYMPLIFNIAVSIYILNSSIVIIAEFIKIRNNLENKVMERTLELREANDKLRSFIQSRTIL